MADFLLPKDNFEVLSTPYELRKITQPIVGKVYKTTYPGYEGDWYYDPADLASADNIGTVIVSGTKRFKRVIESDFISVKWFGAKGNQIKDDTAAIQATFDYVKILNQGRQILFPIGNYKISSTLDFLAPIESTPRIMGESKGRGNAGSTLVWFGSTGGTMMKLRRFHNTTIKYMDFTGNNGTGSPTYPKYLLHVEVDGTNNYYSSFIHISDCSFGGAAGTDSACINLNATGAFTNYQCSEITIEHCGIHGNGINVAEADKTWYGVWVGGFNTKNFYIKNNYVSYFTQAFIKSVADAGAIHSADNVMSSNEWNFYLNSGTQLVSISDYTEASGGLLKTSLAATPSNFTLINFSWFADNYSGATPTSPTTKEYIIDGQGQLNITGCTFFGGASVPKINWNTDNGLYPATVINSNFSGVKEGITPFFSSLNAIGIQDREVAYGQYIQHRWTSIGNAGINAGGGMTYRFPNFSSEDMLVRGLSRISGAIGKPDGSLNNPKRWHDNDFSIDFNTPARGDSRHRVKYWVCTRQGTFKTINVTGTTNNGTLSVTAVSNIAAIEPGDVLNFSANVGNLTFRYTVDTVDYVNNSFTYNPYPANATGVVTFTNAVPVFSAFGGAYGITADRPTLGVNDAGFSYFDTTIQDDITWTGSTWIRGFSSIAEATNYGVKADNLVGSAAANVTGINAALAANDAIILPAGVIYINSSIILTSNKKIYGVGKSRTTIIYTGSDYAFKNTAADVRNVVIEGVEIKTDTGFTPLGCISILNGTNWRLKDIKFNGFISGGQLFSEALLLIEGRAGFGTNDNSYDIRVEDFEFTLGQLDNIKLFGTKAGSQIVFEGGVVEVAGRYGFFLQITPTFYPWNSVHFSDVIFQGNATNEVRIEAGANFTFDSCYFEHVTNSPAITLGKSTGYIYNLKFTNSNISSVGQTGSGVVVSRIDGGVLLGVEFDGATVAVGANSGNIFTNISGQPLRLKDINLEGTINLTGDVGPSSLTYTQIDYGAPAYKFSPAGSNTTIPLGESKWLGDVLVLDTLDSITDNGAVTTNNISVGQGTVTSLIISGAPSTGALTDKLLVRTDGSTAVKQIDTNSFSQEFALSLSTSDDTPTTIATIAITAGQVWEVDVTYFANNSSATAFGKWRKTITASNASGTAALVGAADVIGTDSPHSTSTVDATVSGGNLLLRVTGIAATVLYWGVIYRIRKYAAQAS